MRIAEAAIIPGDVDRSSQIRALVFGPGAWFPESDALLKRQTFKILENDSESDVRHNIIR